MNAIVRSLNTPHRIVSLDTPLSDEQIRRVAPSVFAEDAHESRSDKFVPVPTGQIITALRKEGFMPFYAAQSRSRDEGKREHTKHMVRMRHVNRANADGHAFEIALLNANDGSAAYNLMPGFLRFVCANGMIVSDSYETVKVRHNGRSVLDDVIEGTYRVLQEADQVTEEVQTFKGRWLTRDHQIHLAEAVRDIRWGLDEDDKSLAPIDAERLLAPRRAEDRKDDLWTTLNRLQENALRGGHAYVTRDAQNRRRRATTRPVNGIAQDTAINRAIWKLAQVMERATARAA